MFKMIEQIIHITFNQQHIETQTERHIHSRTKDRQEMAAPSLLLVKEAHVDKILHRFHPVWNM